ncbi:MAG: hypothetical protein IRZ00_05410 [Gemmatimonadetes bacterium]|nr:hypothetical protein [Gemmatimonadota bacterium]
MSVTAPNVPLAPAGDLADEPSRAGTAPAAPPLLGTLLASRPERQRHSGVALGAALVLHALLIVLLISFFHVGPRWLSLLLPDEAGSSADSETVTIVWPIGGSAGGAARSPSAGAAAAGDRVRGPEAPPAPLEFPTHVPTQLPPGPAGREPGPAAAPGAAQAGGAAAGAGMSASERLRPKGYDRRLFDPVIPPVEPTTTDHARALARIKEKIDAVNDSAAAVADAARRATDWTIKDKNGGSWGITPGQLHLGSITLPLPVTLGSMSSTMRAEALKNQRDWAEIQMQADRASTRRTFDERVKAIRERKEKEKAEKEKATTND